MAQGDGSPAIRELDHAECKAILLRNYVGRIAYNRENRIDIRPVHYVYADDWIYGRTSFGEKYRALASTAYQWWPVAFEVDEVEGLFRWRSVIVRGGFYVIDPERSEAEAEAWRNALAQLRTLLPETLRRRDPAPSRTVLFRIAAQEVTGREATPAPDET